MTMMKPNDRFLLLKQLGQGSFSIYLNFIKDAFIFVGTIFSAEDKLRNEKVAVKIEKPDKSKRILMFEYDVLKQLQGMPSFTVNSIEQGFLTQSKPMNLQRKQVGLRILLCSSSWGRTWLLLKSKMEGNFFQTQLSTIW